jgi:hypothetical protein
MGNHPDTVAAWPWALAMMQTLYTLWLQHVPANQIAHFLAVMAFSSHNLSLVVQVICSLPSNFTSWDFSLIDPIVDEFIRAVTKKNGTVMPNAEVASVECFRSKQSRSVSR